MRSRLQLAVGLFGAFNVALGLYVWWSASSGPGDDNAVGMLGLGSAALGTVPAWGLVLWARGRALRAHLMWLFWASVAVVPLAALCAMMLSLVLPRG